MRYRLWIDGVNEEIEAEDDKDARRQAREWARDGDWDLSGGTLWIEVSIQRFVESEDGENWEDVDDVTITIEPPEPKCSDKRGHDWQSPHSLLGGLEENPGVWGHGGGVIINEVCVRCGCGKTTDTWAQRPDTGEQGLHSVSYEEDAYDVTRRIFVAHTACEGDDGYTEFVAKRLQEIYPDFEIEVDRHHGRTKAQVTDFTNRVTERDVEELVRCDLWDEFCSRPADAEIGG